MFLQTVRNVGSAFGRITESLQNFGANSNKTRKSSSTASFEGADQASNFTRTVSTPVMTSGAGMLPSVAEVDDADELHLVFDEARDFDSNAPVAMLKECIEQVRNEGAEQSDDEMFYDALDRRFSNDATRSFEQKDRKLKRMNEYSNFYLCIEIFCVFFFFYFLL